METQLTWAIQFCLGMEHAHRHGITCHRDIKPENILIGAEGVLRISDFGLALVSQKSNPGVNPGRAPVNPSAEGHLGLSLVQVGNQNICGTPGYIPPEVYRGLGADVRSDVYSFGLVLWQMAARSSRPPFAPKGFEGSLADYMRIVYEAQVNGPLPPVAGVLQPIIAKCLNREPGYRYRNFSQLRADLEPLLLQIAGKTVTLPSQSQATVDGWHNRATSMFAVGRYEAALEAFNHALQLAPQNVHLLNGMAMVLSRMGRHTEALFGYDQVLKHQPNHLHAKYNKGLALEALKQGEAALACYEECLALSRSFHQAWYAKGRYLSQLDRLTEALVCCDEVIALQPRFAHAWHLKANIFSKQGRHPAALPLFDEALKRDPLLVPALEAKAACLAKLKRLSDAMVCLDAALALNPKLATAWSEKGRHLFALKKHVKALECFHQARVLEPNSALRWYNIGLVEDARGNGREAIRCFSRFLELAPSREKRIPAVRTRIQRLRAKFS